MPANAQTGTLRTLYILLDWDDCTTTLFPLAAIPKRILRRANLTCAATIHDVEKLQQNLLQMLDQDRGSVAALEAKVADYQQSIDHYQRLLGSYQLRRNQVIEQGLAAEDEQRLLTALETEADQQETFIEQLLINTSNHEKHFHHTYLTKAEFERIEEVLRRYKHQGGYEQAQAQLAKLQAQFSNTEGAKVLRLFSARWNMTYEAVNAGIRHTYCYEHLADIADALGCELDPSLLVDHILGKERGATLVACQNGVDATQQIAETNAFTKEPLTTAAKAKLQEIGINSRVSLAEVYKHIDHMFGQSKNKEVLFRYALNDIIAREDADATISMIVADDNRDILDSVRNTLKDIQLIDPALWRRLDIKVLQIGPHPDTFAAYTSSQDLWRQAAWLILRNAERKLYQKITGWTDVDDQQLQYHALQLEASGALAYLDPKKLLTRRESIITIPADQFGYTPEYIRSCMLTNPLFFKFYNVIVVDNQRQQILNTRLLQQQRQQQQVATSTPVIDAGISLVEVAIDNASSSSFIADLQRSQQHLEEEQRLNPFSFAGAIGAAARRISLFSQTQNSQQTSSDSGSIVSYDGSFSNVVAYDSHPDSPERRHSMAVLSRTHSDLLIPGAGAAANNAFIDVTKAASSITEHPLLFAERNQDATVITAATTNLPLGRRRRISLK